MDIISYSKAMKAKKRITELNKRLGEGNNKSGDKDIIDVHANTNKRLEELEKKRLGMQIQKVVIDTDDKWNEGTLNGVVVNDNHLSGNGKWIGNLVAPEDFLEFDKINLEGSQLNYVTIQTDDGTGLKPLVDGEKIDALNTGKLKVHITLDTPEGYSPNMATPANGSAFAYSTYSGNTGFLPSNLIDENANTEWMSNTDQSLDGYIGMSFKVARHIRRIIFVQGGQSGCLIGKAHIEAVINGAWTRILSNVVINKSPRSSTIIDLPATSPSTSWRIVAAENVSNTYAWKVSDIKMYEGSMPAVVSKLTMTYKARPLLNRVSEMEKSTQINLNKHNLRVDTILNKRRYKLKEMVVDDFEDASGIDILQSVNITHDIANHKIKQTDASQGSTLVTVKETLEAAPTMFSLSAVVNDMATITKDIDFASGTLTDTIMNGEELEMKPVALDEYKKSATWESSVIDLGTGFTRIVRFDKVVDIPSGTGLKMFTSSSVDGLTFEEYREVNSDGTISSSSRRYFKVKAEFASKEEVQPPRIIHDFASVEAANFIANDKIILDGSAKLKTTYSQAMTPVDGYAEEGSLLKTTIDKTMFKSIEKVEVK